MKVCRNNKSIKAFLVEKLKRLFLYVEINWQRDEKIVD